jgi:hypothetical protein
VTSRPARVVRIAPSLRPTDEQRAELRRILGPGVLWHVSPLNLTPSQLLDELRALHPDAVVIHGAGPERNRAVVDAGEFVILRVISRTVLRTYRYQGVAMTESEEVFAGYGLLDDRGEIGPVDDGALVPKELPASSAEAEPDNDDSAF